MAVVVVARAPKMAERGEARAVDAAHARAMKVVEKEQPKCRRAKRAIYSPEAWARREGEKVRRVTEALQRATKMAQGRQAQT